MKPRLQPKQPWEEIIIPIDCTNRLPTGVTVSSATVAMFDSQGQDVSSTMIDGSPSIVNNIVSVKIKGGTDGQKYTLRIRLPLSNGEKAEDELIIYVKET